MTHFLSERAVLRAGIATIQQDHDKAIAILKGAETFHAELASAQSSDLKLPPIVPPGSPQETAPSEREQSMSEMKEEDLHQAKLDNAKKRDYSYRQLMAACLVSLDLSHPHTSQVDYNLSILYGYKSNHVLEKVYLEKACDAMVVVLNRATTGG
jgi:hypothetical protein